MLRYAEFILCVVGGHSYSFTVLLFLTRSPYLMNRKGIGMSRHATIPSSVLPQPYPSFAYICWLLSGIRAAHSDLETVLAAMALAA